MNANKTQTIAILGANGRLSREVARAFHASGWNVRAITRNGKSAPLQELDGIELVAANAMDANALMHATRGCDAIFNGLNPAYTDWVEQCLPMAKNALAAAKSVGAVHLFPGNIYNFGSKLPETLTPETTALPDHRKAHIRCEMESMFKAAANQDNVQTIILRAGDFYGGDGTGSWFDLALASSLEKGKATYPGNRNIVHAWAYLPDLAKAFVGLAEKSGQLSRFENFHFEGHNVSGNEMHNALELAMGRPLKQAGLHRLIFKIAGWFNPMMREVSEVFYQWNTPHQVKDERLAEVIGPLPRTPLNEAVRQAVKAQGIAVDQSTDVATRLLPA